MFLNEVRRVAMLTGDSGASANRVAAEAGITEVHHGLLPEGKLDRLEAILGEERGRGSVIFVGDGVNDAPVLARADAGIAMGGGSDAAVESADVVLMSGEPSRVVEAIERAKRTRRIVAQNIVFALGIKLPGTRRGRSGSNVGSGDSRCRGCPDRGAQLDEGAPLRETRGVLVMASRNLSNWR